jgi:hypothetical protein
MSNPDDNTEHNRVLFEIYAYIMGLVQEEGKITPQHRLEYAIAAYHATGECGLTIANEPDRQLGKIAYLLGGTIPESLALLFLAREINDWRLPVLTKNAIAAACGNILAKVDRDRRIETARLLLDLFDVLPALAGPVLALPIFTLGRN